MTTTPSESERSHLWAPVVRNRHRTSGAFPLGRGPSRIPGGPEASGPTSPLWKVSLNPIERLVDIRLCRRRRWII